MTSVCHDIVVMSAFYSLTGAVCGVGNTYPSGAPGFTSGFHRGPCCPVNFVSLFHVIAWSFGVSFYIYIFYLLSRRRYIGNRSLICLVCHGLHGIMLTSVSSLNYLCHISVSD